MSKELEALECLEVLEQDIKDRIILDEDRQLKLCAVIKQALLKAEKELKALEIIKKKYPNEVETMLCKDYEQYKLRKSSQCYTVKIDWNDKPLLDYLLLLTEEEFNLLKEVLE